MSYMFLLNTCNVSFLKIEKSKKVFLSKTEKDHFHDLTLICPSHDYFLLMTNRFTLLVSTYPSVPSPLSSNGSISAGTPYMIHQTD
jgi:hypothetical protein